MLQMMLKELDEFQHDPAHADSDALLRFLTVLASVATREAETVGVSAPAF